MNNLFNMFEELEQLTAPKSNRQEVNITNEQLNERLCWPFERKVEEAIHRIEVFYSFCRMNNKGMWLAFSGGKDSTVLLHLIRNNDFCKNIPVVFFNTGLEYPEIVDFVKTVPNVIWHKSEKNFKEIIDECGYPVISKDQASCIEDYLTTNSEKLREVRMGNGAGSIKEKWRFMINAPFKISAKCCYWLKKQPSLQIQQLYGYPILGTRVAESRLRRVTYLRFGCNIMTGRKRQSMPLAIWTDENIQQYIEKYNIQYSKIYDMGYSRTGCMFCCFGLHLTVPNRFQLMKQTHPNQYKYCMEKLKIKEVLEYMGVPYE